LTTAATAAYQYSATDELPLYALKRRKTQKQCGFWAKSTYGHCIKDEALIDVVCKTARNLQKRLRTSACDIFRRAVTFAYGS